MDGQVATLDIDTAMRLLADHHVGRIALNADGGPVVHPVNYVFDAGTILFRTDRGRKLEAAARREDAAFQIDHVDEAHRVGWSVLVRGRLAQVVDAGELGHLDVTVPDPFVHGDGKQHHVRLLPRVITGRRVLFSADVPAGWFRSVVEGTAAFKA